MNTLERWAAEETTAGPLSGAGSADRDGQDR
jgi:hypothetical protein